MPSSNSPNPRKHSTVPLPQSTLSSPVATSPLSKIGSIKHRVGDRIKDRYEVREHLGGGNFGSVYKVLDSAVGNILACKEMHVLDDASTLFDERGAALELFKREALNLATLRHPHIPSAYFEQEEGDWRICPRCGFHFPAAPVCPDHGADLVSIRQRYYLLMDFIDGQTLEELATRSGKPLDEKHCLEWMAQVGSALRSLHRVGIVHRDIKPDNIKIRASDKTAMLLDFGLTKKVEEAGGYGTSAMTGTTRFGTLGYAPENPHERENPERRSDIYALGMTLYRLLSGRDPQEPNQLKTMRDFTPRYFNKNISPETERLIAVAAAPEMSWRYQSIDDFLADLKAIHTSDDDAPQAPALTYADGSKARNANDLARLLERKKDESAQYLFNGTFKTWLSQNGFAHSAQAADDAVQNYKEQPERALEMFRRSLYPTGATGVLPHLSVMPGALHLGALESGATATAILRLKNTGPGLVWGTLLIENDEDASTPLPGLQIPAEFQGNDSRLEITLNTSRVAVGEYSGFIKVSTEIESGRVPVSYSIAPLDLYLEPDNLDFGTIQVGQREKRTLRVRPKKLMANGGRARGTIYAGPRLKGVVAPERFDGSDPIEIEIDALASGSVAQIYQGILQIDTNGGRFRLPISYRIALAPDKILSLIGTTALNAALVAGALRIAYVLVDPAYTATWLAQDGAALSLTTPSTSSWGAVLAGAAAALYFSQPLSKKLVAEDRHKRDKSLRSIVSAFCVLAGGPIGWLLAFVLHYAFWGLGDLLLFPVVRAQTFLPPDNPLLAWAAAGGIGGLLWGVGRAGVATGQLWMRYAVYLLLGLAFLLLMLNAMIFGGR